LAAIITPNQPTEWADLSSLLHLCDTVVLYNEDLRHLTFFISEEEKESQNLFNEKADLFLRRGILLANRVASSQLSRLETICYPRDPRG